MIFTDLFYFTFLIVSVALYRKANEGTRYWVIIASGLGFYAYYSTGYLGLLIAEMLIVFYLTQWGTKLGRVLAIVIPLLALGYYKYASFAYLNVAPLLGGNSSSDPFLYLALPLAISFFTFEFIHYTIEMGRGNITSKSIERFLAFSLFFPSMAAGPIKRFNEFDEQIHFGPPKGNQDYIIGTIRILGGLFKKLVLGNSFWYIASELTNQSFLATATPSQLWIGVAAFTLYVYFDFSGYTDIAIGSAQLFGIKIPENFNYPLLARNIADYWRRWHISLYRWFMDYVFKPLSVSLRDYGPWGICASLLVVFSLSGLWHGSDWNYIVWGLYNGVALVIYFLYSRSLKPILSKHAFYHTQWANALAIGFNLFIVVLSFAFFALPLASAIFTVKKMLLLG